MRLLELYKLVEQDPGIEQFQNYIQGKYGIHFELDNIGKSVELSSVQAKKDSPPGTGTAAIQELVNWADKNGIMLTLQFAEKGYQPAKAGKKTTSKGRLEKFYRRFGFVPNRGRYKRFELSMYTSMYRDPKSINESGAWRSPYELGFDRILLHRAWYNTQTNKAVFVPKGSHHTQVAVKNPRVFGIESDTMAGYKAAGMSIKDDHVEYDARKKGWARVGYSAPDDSAFIDAQIPEIADVASKWYIEYLKNNGIYPGGLDLNIGAGPYKRGKTYFLTGKPMWQYIRHGYAALAEDKLMEEKVVQAAFFDPVTNTVYPVGKIHTIQPLLARGIPEDVIDRIVDEQNQGFVTNTGRFLNRREAASLSGPFFGLDGIYDPDMDSADISKAHEFEIDKPIATRLAWRI